MGNLIDRHGIRKTLASAIVLTTLTGLLIPLSSNLYYIIVVVTAFTIGYTTIFIALYSRMSDIMREDKIAMTGAIATFKDLGYTVGPLLAGRLIEVINITNTFLLVGGAFILLLPVAVVLHD
jgi:MFS family permease